MILPTDAQLEVTANEIAAQWNSGRAEVDQSVDETGAYRVAKLEDLKLARTVRGYMQHIPGCFYNEPEFNNPECTCGYEAAMKELEAFLGITPTNTTEG